MMSNETICSRFAQCHIIIQRVCNVSANDLLPAVKTCRRYLTVCLGEKNQKKKREGEEKIPSFHGKNQKLCLPDLLEVSPPAGSATGGAKGRGWPELTCTVRCSEVRLHRRRRPHVHARGRVDIRVEDAGIVLHVFKTSVRLFWTLESKKHLSLNSGNRTSCISRLPPLHFAFPR